MTVELIIKEMEKVENEQRNLSAKKAKLIDELRNASRSDWDWISVREASAITGKSVGFFYGRINSGLLSTKHLGSSVMVKKSEINAINDKFSA